MTKPKKSRNLYTFGNTLKDGKLYLFQPNELVVIRGWPEMRAWRRTPVRGGWTHVRPELQLIPHNGTFQTARRDSDWLASICPARYLRKRWMPRIAGCKRAICQRYSGKRRPFARSS